MVTVRDVARKAGVSIATVSRVINRKGRYTGDTERRVLTAARELGYSVNVVARSLKTGTTRTIGISLGDYFLLNFPVLLSSAADVLRAQGFGIQVFLNTRLEACVRFLSDGKLDGLLLTEAEKDDLALKALIETGKQFVFLGGDIEREDVNLVEIDYFQGGYLAALHLLNLGHSDILFVSENESHLLTREIKRGYLTALDERGVQYREELIRHPGEEASQSEVRPEGESSLRELDRGERTGYEAVEWATGNADFSAVLATDDRIACGALRALQERGVRVPEERSLIGFGNFGASAFLSPPLTTVDIPLAQMGELGAEILANNILRKDVVVKRVKLKVNLIQRETTAARPRAAGRRA